MYWQIGDHKAKKFKTKGRLRYSSKDYTNPYFTEKKKSVKSNFISIRLTRRIKIIIFTLIIFLISSLFYLLYSSYFTITEFYVKGEGRVGEGMVEKIVREQINDSFFILLPQKNIFLFSSKKLRATLEKKYAFNSLDITKKLPNKLQINYIEKEYAIIWQENDNYYYADIEGFIISEANLLEVGEKDYPIIVNKTDFGINENWITIDITYINFVKKLFEKFREIENEIKVIRYVVDNEQNTVKVLTENGPEIYFNIQNDLDKQIEKLLVIKSEKLKENFEKKTYIDLRYGDRVYYR